MKEFTPEEVNFITRYANNNIPELMLQAGRHPTLPVMQLVQHIQARQKAKYKLPTWFQNPAIRYPASLSIEQSSSENTAAYKATLLNGDILIDLTGGFGIDSFYFSKNVKQVFYIEQSAELCEVALFNSKVLGTENITFNNGDAQDFLTNFGGKADWIYLDPARRDAGNKKLHLLEDCEPDILQLLPLLLLKADNILLKTSPMLDIDQAINQLDQVHMVYVVAVDNECKEVLYHLKKRAGISLEIKAINLLTTGEQQEFNFTLTAEENSAIKYVEPEKFIYEPNAAILKAGGFKSLAQAFKLNKLHRNSHLYTSEKLVENFPGRMFLCKSVQKYSTKELLKHLGPDKKANITVRNFPETVAQIRKKTGIKEGGSVYLFATTNIFNKPTILVCEKI